MWRNWGVALDGAAGTTGYSRGRKKTGLDRIGQEGPLVSFLERYYTVASAGHLNSRVQYLAGKKEECKG